MPQITKILFFSYLMGFSVLGWGQNLVPNPSFEQYSSCPTQSSEIILVNDWVDANTGTTDYFNSCFTSGGVNVDVPANWMGVQNAKTGNAYVGIMLFENSSAITDYREYIQTQLSSTLSNGVKYYVSFNISRADSSCYCTDDIGVYFSAFPISQGNYLYINQNPQVSNVEGNVLTGITNWVEVQGSFVANGGEQFITLGNFNNDAATDTVSTCSTTNLDYMSAYYYIDDVCVSTDSLTCAGVVGVPTNSFNDFYNITINNHNLIIESDRNEVINASIYDMTGKLHHQLVNQQNLVQFNTGHLNAGIYLIIVYHESERFTKKIFINP